MLAPNASAALFLAPLDLSSGVGADFDLASIPNCIFDFRADKRVYTTGGQTFVAGNKCSLVAGSRVTTRTAGVSFFFECWLKPTALSGFQTLFWDGGDTNKRGFQVYLNNAYVSVALSSGTGDSTFNLANNALTAGVWNHLIVNCERTTGVLTIYVNGTSVATADISSLNGNDVSSPAIGNFLTIAAYPGGLTPFGGEISAMRHGIGSTLDSDDVLYLYNSKNPRYYGDLSADYLAKLGANGHNWDLTEPLVGDPTYVTGATATVVDQHGTNDLTFTNAELVTNGGFETRTGRTWANFVAGDKSMLSYTGTAADLRTDDATIVISFKTPAAFTSSTLLSAGTQGAGNDYWWLYWSTSSGILILEFNDSSGAAVGYSGPTLAINTVYTLVIKLNRDGNATYKLNNGAEGVFGDISGKALSCDPGNFRVGGYAAGYSNVTAQIAQVGIKHRLTSDAEDTEYYNSGIGKYYNEMTTGAGNLQSDWLVFYDLTEASGIRYDSVGSNNLEEEFGELVTNGTFTGGITGWDNTTYPCDTANATDVADKLHIADVDAAVHCIQQALTLVAGRSYTLSVNSVTATTGALRVNVTSGHATNPVTGPTLSFADTGAKTNTAVASGSAWNLNIGRETAFDFVVDDVSLKSASIPCVSDTNVFSGWSPYGTANVESIDPQAGNLSMRSGAVNYGVQQNILTVGSQYAVTVASKASAASKVLMVQTGSSASAYYHILTTSYATYPATAAAKTCAGNTTLYILNYASNTTGTVVYVDSVSCKCVALSSSNGPATAIASDSIGSNHATLVGRTAAALITDWKSQGPDGSYTTRVQNSSVLGTGTGSAEDLLDGTMVGFSDVDAARVDDVPAGRTGHSIKFDGTNDYVNVPSVSLSDLGIEYNTAFTLSLFCKVTASSGYHFLVSKRTGAGYTGFSVYYNATTSILYVDVCNTATTNQRLRTFTIALATWKHLTITSNGINAAGIKLFADGIEVSGGTSADTLSATIANAAVLSLGRDTHGTGGNYLNGHLYDVRFYTTDLSASAAALYANTYSATNPVASYIDGTDTPRSVPNLEGIGGLNHDGTDDYEIATVANFRSGDSSGAVSLWYKGTDTSAVLFGTADEGTAGGTYMDLIYTAANVLEIQQRNASDVLDRLQYAVNISDGAMHNIVVVSTGTAYRLFVDSMEVINPTIASGSNSGDWFSDTLGSGATARDNFTIGCIKHSSGVVGPTLGLISDVRVYDSQIVADAAANAAALYAGEELAFDPVARWKFDDGPQSNEPANGSPIVQWIDYSINRWQAWQTTPASRGTYDAGSENLNYLPSLVFDGTDDLFSVTGEVTTSTEVTGFAVFETGATAFATEGEQTLCSTGDIGTDDYYYQLGIDANGKLFIETTIAGTTVRATATNALELETVYVISWTSNGTAHTLVVNQVAETLTGTNNGKAPGAVTLRDYWNFGALKINAESDFFGGKLARIVLYDDIKNAQVRRAIEQALAVEYRVGI